ncbi:hypothetical protein LUZ60_011668 [Juncus effusus]|nr:hypothetical protein LUZ60_011668 [Juncus effusus]
MRARKGKDSESFWPSIVMKKWLNIRPKLHDFSEDEFETECDDDASENREIPFCEDSGIKSNNYNTRPRRRKSETFRVNYITKKDVRVMIGTWNIAGINPSEEINLNEWLCTTQLADLYILGFQEVVPLNAGNVLGAEDKRPISKWETLIRSTLNNNNKSQNPSNKSFHKSYSAPPSPNNENNNTKNILKNTVKNDIKHEPNDILDWPEYSLDTPVRTGTKLRRVSTGLNLNLSLKTGLNVKRVYHSSGNLNMLWSEQEENLDFLNSIEDFSSDKVSEEEGLNCETKKMRGEYVKIVGKQMVGIYISVWVCRKIRRHVNNLEVSPVGVGLMGYMGNKGSVSISMSFFQTRLCFVCSHLTSGHKTGDQQKRNSDVYEILQRTRFSSLLDSQKPLLIPSHDRIFWFGDLNYRLEMPDSQVRYFVALNQWDLLLNSDQLRKELKTGNTFEGWEEGEINFAPTYKYEINSEKYVGEIYKEGEKKRTPAWCDRILWSGKGIKQLSYWSSDLRLSDHRPVSALFSVELEVLNQRKLERVLNFTNAGS